jgi:hypothetical protein
MKTTTVDLVIRLEVVGDQRDVEACRGPLKALAAVMGDQAADGLYTLGTSGEVIANILSTTTGTVLIGTTTDRLITIAEELATIASHAVHVPGKTTAMDERIAALVHELDASKEMSQ